MLVAGMNCAPATPRFRGGDSKRRCSARCCIGTALLLVVGRLAAQPADGEMRSSRNQPDMGALRLEPLPIFFPPSPPPLGRPFARASTAGRNAAPPELAAYVNEPFYPVLSTRIVTKTLTEKQRAQLERYRVAKLALQQELRDELGRVRSLEPAPRAAELAAFARRQTPKIVELENTAEQLRRDLLNADNTWSAVRQWRLNYTERRGFSPMEIGQVMRGSAYYDTALLPAQRRLLREIFLELANATDNTESAKEAQPYLFFPPEPARVLLPDNLPADLAARVAAYQTKKSRLKKELYDTVYAQDAKALGFMRTNALKALAGKQAAALAEIEQLAEEIRVGLAQVAEPAAIAERSPLPPTLHQRVVVLTTNFSALQKDAAARIEAILGEARELPIQTNFRFEADGLKYVVVPTRTGRGGVAADTAGKINALRTRIATVADDYGQALAQLVNEKDTIRSELAQVLGNANAADRAMAAALRVIGAQATVDSYRDYRVAVFQPGLSAEQRRLLFDSVVVQLDLPLPRGETQPTYRAAAW